MEREAYSGVAGPLRKRPRCSSGADPDATLVDIPKVVRDPEYYREDGDCKIRVENTLFSIHRFLLARDSSAFETMFQLPQGTQSPQGSTDVDPIVLTGDTTEEFRALCWALYALPDEILKQNTKGNSMFKLIKVAAISHKYHLAAFQSWSMGSIRQRCDPRGNRYLDTCLSATLAALLDLFILYSNENFIGHVENAWTSRLRSDLSRSDHLHQALACAERHGLRKFMGNIYSTQLAIATRVGLENGSSSVATQFPNADKLDAKHLQRLLLGSWSLSMHWQRLTTTIPQLPQGTCLSASQHKMYCVATWKSWWLQSGTQGGPMEVRKKLQHILDTANSVYNGTVEGILITRPCASTARGIVGLLIKQLDATLADHFLGPLPNP
ncbi:hypothetical protein C8J57DRAFT_123943 [Mycena rebaudengoi]|nr:hypothetical protein C8J57DRAFT_123943 [Mycena rebaudengoi]